MSWGTEIEIKELENYFDRGYGRKNMFGFGGGIDLMPLRCEKDYLEAYRSCAPLKSIIAKRALAFNTGKLVITNTNTGKEATGRSSLKSILKNPNVLQTGKSFFTQQNIYLDTYGYCPVVIIRPSGMPDEISSMWNIPPWLFDIQYTNKWLKQSQISGIFDSYYIFWNGERVELDMKNVKFIFDSGIGTDYDSNLTIPDSRLISLELPVSNIVAAYKARNTLITKRGAIGILSNDTKDGDAGTAPLKPGDKENLQKDFSRYGLVGQAYQVIVTDAALKWQQMGFPTKDLLLFEEIEDDIGRLCEAYGLPQGMMARNKDTTFANQKQNRKDFIENTIVPDSEARMEQFTEIVAPEDTISITRDYSGLTVFQEDEKLKAEKIKVIDEACEKEYKNGLITKNMWLIRIGQPQNTEDPTFDEYYDASKEADAAMQRQITLNGAKGGNQGTGQGQA